MSRNGSGAYTVPNSFTAGQPIIAADHNENWSDMASEMSNSVAADGQTSMTGPLKCSSGSLALPSQSFASDTNTGRYRKAADTMADVCGGVEIAEISSTGVDVTGTVSASVAIDAPTVKQNGFALMPVGIVAPYAGLTAPDGWLLCYGQAVSRTTYAALYNVLGGQHGSGDGSTTFNLPDLRGRVAAGQDDMGGVSANRLTGQTGGVNGDTFAASGGEETHTLTQAELPNVNLSSASLGASVTNGGDVLHSNLGSAFPAGGGGTNVLRPTDVSKSDVTVAITGSVPLGGSGTAHNVVQPTLILNYIIYAGV